MGTQNISGSMTANSGSLMICKEQDSQIDLVYLDADFAAETRPGSLVFLTLKVAYDNLRASLPRTCADRGLFWQNSQRDSH